MAKKNNYIKERKTKTGTIYYEVQMMDNNTGKMYSKCFSEKKYGSKSKALEFAKRHRDEKRSEMLRGGITPINNNQYTLQNVFDMTIDFDGGVLTTKKKMTSTFNKFIINYFKDSICFDKITAIEIQSNLNKIADIASNDTLDRVLSIWRKMYRVATIKNIVIKDETISVNKPKSNYVVKSREKVTSLEEVNKVSDCLMRRMENKREAQLICDAMQILYYETMRPQEVFALSKKSVDIVNKTINIFESIGCSSTESNIIKNPKTPESKRVLPMHENLIPLFKRLIKESSGDYFFIKDDGVFMSGNWASDAIRRYRPKDCSFTLYNERHQITTDLIDNGIDLRTVQELMGHSTAKMTLAYARSNENKMKLAIQSR